MEKKYLYAGVSEKLTKDGYKWTFRTANNAQARTVQLQRLGDRNVDIMPLLKPMTKIEAALYLSSINFQNGDTAILECLARTVK